MAKELRKAWMMELEKEPVMVALVPVKVSVVLATVLVLATVSVAPGKALASRCRR